MIDQVMEPLVVEAEQVQLEMQRPTYWRAWR